ncbi:transglycosylase domain-containing protein [Bacillus taeanensis]|uniref:Penicillin-binding protein n=1 Tax=Bacillus taeanensis TaxID=273032 RepID=A0A366XSE9_9BACI|nr:PBP1A family penicillin-binding protein [Bacillus taeanensis]RBW69310.1 penicillin-binding protein [Bacillus taeanensis]
MIKKASITAALFVGIIFLGLIGYLLIIFAGNYVIDEKKLVMNETTTIVDEEEHVITKLYVQNRELVDIKDIPDHVKNTFLAVEDIRFYEHSGIDMKAIFRALYRDLLAGSKVEGGSTITQQLAKNIFLSNEKSFLRKTKEVIIALNLEHEYTKSKILEMYLNQIYFGHGAYGIQSASHLYFNKKVSELTVEEGALLAALPKAPASYSPIDYPEKSKERRDLVLSLLAKHNFISAQEAVRLQGKTLSLNVQKLTKDESYLTYIDMILEEAEKKYHLTSAEVLRGGYKIVVPMNKTVQQTVFKLFQKGEYFPGSNSEERPEGGLVLMDSTTGGIIAVQGGREYAPQGFNHIYAKRQPGSTFKPLAVYGPALESENYDPYTLLKDERINYGGYEPQNYNNSYQGEVTMYDALKDSLNAPAVWLLNEMGIDKAKKTLTKLDFAIFDNDLKIALGGIDEGVSPYQLMKAYRAFNENGKLIEPYVISKIYNQNGKLIGQAVPEEKQVFSKQTAWYMTKMLEAVVKEGTAQKGEIHTALAGKTGTTSYEKIQNGNRDAWFVGYTPEVVGAVWIGYDRTDNNHYLTGGSSYPTALMKDLLNEMPSQNGLVFKKPKGAAELEPPIRFVEINDLEGGVTFANGWPSVRLTWTPAEDDRLQYHIYETDGEKRTLLDTVTGAGEYISKNLSLFTEKQYLIVPYNPQIDREGKESNAANVDLFPGVFQKSNS